MARRRSTRIGFGIGGGSWVSFGRSGVRVGTRAGKVRVSTGRSGTRLSARDGRFFVSTWVPGERRRPAAGRSGSTASLWLLLLVLSVIGLIAHLTGHG